MPWWNRSDGRLVRDLPLTRRSMPYVMKTRSGSEVYCDHSIELRAADDFLRRFNQQNPGLRADVFHLFVWASCDAFVRHPNVNRFVAGGRLYQRDDVTFSYAVKEALRVDTAMLTIKHTFDPRASFADHVRMMTGQADETRFHHQLTGTDRELELLMRLPGWARRVAMGGVDVANRFGMLPRSYIESDPLFATVFFANMASIGMPSAYHHLYDYGTIGIFGVMGRPHPMPGSPASGPERRRAMTVRWTFDERVEDGLEAWLCMKRIKITLEDPDRLPPLGDRVAPAPGDAPPLH
jgi:hypothetical protein